jgi:hypothetical protein
MNDRGPGLHFRSLGSARSLADVREWDADAMSEPEDGSPRQPSENWRPRKFDGMALFEALDGQRQERDLSWPQVARQMWDQSAALNDRRDDHPISPSTLTHLSKRGDTSCQHALFMMRWLDRSPESFLAGTSTTPTTPLPVADSEHRLRWDLQELYEAMNDRRTERGLTWAALAGELRCSPNQISGLRTVKYAISMKLTMRIVQWLGRPAADFVYVSTW